jgi:nucleotide-binding universal stress UspA family protein
MKILIGYDGSTCADAAIEDLRRAGLPPQAEALVICVADGSLPSPDEISQEADSDDSWRSRLDEAEKLAEKAAAHIRSYFPGWTISTEGLWGSPAHILLDAVGWWHSDLVVLGSHGRSPIARLFLGSVSMELIHKAPCSVRVARTGGSTLSGPVRIIIGNDGSTEAEAVIRAVAARSWAEKTEAQIISAVQTLVPATATALEANTFMQEPAYTVICEIDERERSRLHTVSETSGDALRRAGLITTCSVLDGDPRDMILAEADLSNADAIFVGARGLGRMERLLLGSVSSHIVTHARCSVEVVRGQSQVKDQDSIGALAE